MLPSPLDADGLMRRAVSNTQMWITNSAEADIFLVFATVDPSKGYKGITCFLVEKSMGVEIAKKEMKVRLSSFCSASSLSDFRGHC